LNIKNLTFSFPLHRDAWRFVIGYLIDGRSRIMAYDGLNLGSPQEAICKRLEQFFADKGVAVD